MGTCRVPPAVCIGSGSQKTPCVQKKKQKNPNDKRAYPVRSQREAKPQSFFFGRLFVHNLFSSMAGINDALPTEVLDAILLGSVPEPMRLVVGRVCTLWRCIVAGARPPTDTAAIDDNGNVKGKTGNENNARRASGQRDASVPGPWKRLEAYAAHIDALGLFGWFDAIGRPRSATACAEAVMAGRTSTLVWLVERGWPVDMTVYEAGAASQDDGAMKWLMARPDVPPLSDMVLRVALIAGLPVERLDWLVDHAGAPWHSGRIGAMWSAGLSGKVDVVEWVARRGPQPPIWSDAIEGASLVGHIALLDYLEAAGHLQDAQGNDVDLTLSFWAAVAHGRLAALDWLVARRPDLIINDQAMRLAATEGTIDALRWLVERNLERGPNYAPKSTIVDAAARAGRLDALRYLCEPGAIDTDERRNKPLCAPTSDIYFAAAAADQWHVVEWAASAGVPWDAIGIIRWLLNTSGRPEHERDRCVRLIDRGFWRCSPWMRDLVAELPHAGTTPGQQNNMMGMQHFISALAKAMGFDDTVTLGPAYGPMLQLILNGLTR